MRRTDADGDNAESQTAKPSQPATGGAKLNGAHHHLNGHSWKPDEIEALRDSGKAAAAPRTGKMLSREAFDEIVNENMGALYLAQRNVLLRAICDLSLAPSHRGVLAESIRLMRSSNRGMAHPGSDHYAAVTGFSPGVCANALTDLRAKLYMASAKFAAETGGKALSHHTVIRPSAQSIRAHIATASASTPKAQQEAIGEVRSSDKAEFTDHDGEDSPNPQQAVFTANDGEDRNADFIALEGEDRKADFTATPPLTSPLNTDQPLGGSQTRGTVGRKGVGSNNTDAANATSSGDLLGDDAAQGAQLDSQKPSKFDRLIATARAAYPGPAVKTDAVDAIARELAKLVPRKVAARDLLAGIKHFAANPGVSDLKFVPKMQNWLQDGSWRRHVEAAKATTTKPAPPTLDPTKMSEAEWKPHIKAYFETGAWDPQLRARPREEGCLAPERWVRHFEALKGASQ